MLWLLPLDPGNTRVRLEAGLHVVPKWYSTYEWEVLAEVLRRVLEPTVEHSMVLSPEAATVAWPKSDCLLIAIENPMSDAQRSAVARQAREQHHHVLIAAREEDGELTTAWLERWIKPAVIGLLERGPWRTGHPLASYRLGSFDIDSIAAITEDPVELLWILDRTIRHRLEYAAVGLEQNDYERSLRHVAGRRCAELLQRGGLDEEALDLALHILIGGTITHKGRSAVAQAGLGHWNGERFDPRPIARVPLRELVSAEDLVREIERSHPSISASDILQLRRTSSSPANDPSSIVEILDYSSFALPLRSTHALTLALEDGLLELRHPPPLFHEVLDAIRHWEHSSWDPNTIKPLRDLRPKLRPLTSTPIKPHRRFANALTELLSILTTTAHLELDGAIHATKRLQSIFSHPLEPSHPLKNWEFSLTLAAILECADHHMRLAIDRSDLSSATSLYHEAFTLGQHHGDDGLLGRAAMGLADIAKILGNFDESLRILKEDSLPAVMRCDDHRARADVISRIGDILQIRGKLEEALDIRKNKQLPIYEEVKDIRGKAITMGKIADILQATGELEKALDIRKNEQLPIYERIGDIREKAVTLGKIADIHRARSELSEALDILKKQQLPMYERIGDIREKAITMGRIADIHKVKGDLDTALQIRQSDELPVYERLGDKRSAAVCMTNIALILLQRRDSDDHKEAMNILSEAYDAFDFMRLLPEIRIIANIKMRYGIDLEPTQPLDIDQLRALEEEEEEEEEEEIEKDSN